jgi:Domain of unknown function (DUF4388)
MVESGVFSGVATMSFTGTFSELALSDLVEITTLGAKTGVLDVSHADGSPAGRLAFRGGALVSASCGALSGARGFYALLALAEGGFVFDSELDPGAADEGDPLPTGSLLMEAMRRVDEIDHLRDALPAATPVAALAGVPRDAVETTVLGYLGPGPLPVNDLVARGVAEGAADEHDVLAALARLRERGVVTLLS